MMVVVLLVGAGRAGAGRDRAMWGGTGRVGSGRGVAATGRGI